MGRRVEERGDSPMLYLEEFVQGKMIGKSNH
jgi:hypothetical protein